MELFHLHFERPYSEISNESKYRTQNNSISGPNPEGMPGTRNVACDMSWAADCSRSFGDPQIRSPQPQGVGPLD